VTSRPGARAYRVEAAGATAHETPIEAVCLRAERELVAAA